MILAIRNIIDPTCSQNTIGPTRIGQISIFDDDATLGTWQHSAIVMQWFLETKEQSEYVDRIQRQCEIALTRVLKMAVRVSTFTCVADMPHRRRHRSASTEQLDVPTCRRSTVGGRAFPVAYGAKVWNDLPSDVTSASSLSVFKNRLKTYFFRHCYETV